MLQRGCIGRNRSDTPGFMEYLYLHRGFNDTQEVWPMLGFCWYTQKGHQIHTFFSEIAICWIVRVRKFSHYMFYIPRVKDTQASVSKNKEI